MCGSQPVVASGGLDSVTDHRYGLESALVNGADLLVLEAQVATTGSYLIRGSKVLPNACIWTRSTAIATKIIQCEFLIELLPLPATVFSCI